MRPFSTWNFGVILLSFLLFQSGLTEERRLFILHTNDIHGHIEAHELGGLERVAAAVKTLRSAFGDQVILLDGGDTSLGTPLSGTFQGKPTAEIMAAMKYDAIAIGNHEFNWGKDTMRKLTTAMKSPVLCANLVTKDGSPAPYPAFTKFQRNGINIGVIGLVTDDTYRRAPVEATAGWEFLTPQQAVRSHLPLIGEVDLLISLNHIGLDVDRKLAHQVPEIDVIVGGHSHTPLHSVVTENETPIVQAGCYARHLGVLEILVDTESGEVTTQSYRLLNFDQNSPTDPTAHEIVEQYATELRPIFNRVAATVSETLSKHPIGNHYDTPLGNFISDVFRQESGTDIAIYNRGGVRFDMLAGDLTVGRIHKLFPFDDNVTVLRGTGRDIWNIIEQGTIEGEGPLSASGLKVEFKRGKLKKVWINGKRLRFHKTYTLATTGFLSGGGDGMSAITNMKKIRKLPYTRDVLLNYLKTHPVIELPASGRFPMR